MRIYFENLGSLCLYDVSGHYKLFGSQPTSFSNNFNKLTAVDWFIYEKNGHRRRMPATGTGVGDKYRYFESAQNIHINIGNIFGHKNIDIFSEQKAKMSMKNEREGTQKKERSAGLVVSYFMKGRPATSAIIACDL